MRYGISGLRLLLVAWPLLVGTPIVWASSVEQAQLTPKVEGLDLQAFDDNCQRTFRVRASRGYASSRRVGFFQMALAPTMELEEVVVEHRRSDGTIQQWHFPQASLDWRHKTLLTTSGKPIFKNE